MRPMSSSRTSSVKPTVATCRVWGLSQTDRLNRGSAKNKNTVSSAVVAIIRARRCRKLRFRIRAARSAVSPGRAVSGTAAEARGCRVADAASAGAGAAVPVPV